MSLQATSRATADRRAGLAPAPRPPSVADARATTRRVAHTFAIACRLLPAAVRDDVYLLYLVFRTLDDLVDEQRPEAAARIDATDAWARHRTGDRTAEVQLLEDLAVRHAALPRAAVADFCIGMRHDLAGATYATNDDLDRYCYQVAGTVGLVMTSVLGAHDSARADPAAAALGMAMQRTNILRDIDEDAANGRTYIPTEVIDRHGSLAPGRRAGLMREQIARADLLYDQGLTGVRELRHGRRAVAAAGTMYREILREIERSGYGCVAGRVVVADRRKAWIAARAALRA